MGDDGAKAIQMVFHELKGPLNGIIGLPQVMQADANLTQEQRTMLQAIVEAGYKILDLVNQTSMISKIEQGVYTYTPCCFDLNNQIQNAMHNSHSLALDKGIELRMAGPEDTNHLFSLWVEGDELCAYFIFSNLIKNAVEASPVNQTVTVNTEQRNPKALQMELLPVPDMRTACRLWRIYAPGQGPTLVQAFRPNQSPKQVLATLLSLPDETILHVEREYNLVRSAVHSLCSGLDLSGLRHVLNLLAPADDPSTCHQTLLPLVLDSVDVSILEDVYRQSPELCVRLCRLHLMRCRHQGRIQDWESWREFDQAKNLAAEVAGSDQGEAKLLMFAAERIVQEKHNRFTFEPDLDQVLGSGFQKVLQNEEDRFQSRLHLHPWAVHRGLGCLYGTLAQHYGFCGPAYLDTCLHYVHQAQKAFGQGQRPDYTSDWLREFAYLVYAHLDAGQWQEAEAALKAYLQCPDLNRFPPGKDNAFEQAMFVRFMAESGHSLPPAYTDWWRPRIGDVPRAHPWQLWALNMGRLLPDRSWRKICWETAVRVCLEIPGETIKAMLLMPLACLDQQNLASAAWLQSHTDQTLQVIRTHLDAQHFARLLSAPNWPSVLALTREHAATLFPFAYR